MRKLAVREMPVSGCPDELLHAAGIDAEAIASAARTRRRRPRLAQPRFQAPGAVSAAAWSGYRAAA